MNTSPFLPVEALACCPSLARVTLQELSGKAYNGSAQESSNAIAPAHAFFPVYIGEAATSSLDVAHALARHGLMPPWSSVLVQSQSAGRGQMRRAWQSPQGNIYAALALPMQGALKTLAAAPAFSGLMAEALNRLGFTVAIKWPNDLLIKDAEGDYAKAGGILLEEHGQNLVAGIGLNLVYAPPPEELRKNYALKAGVLPAVGLNACTLWAQLVRNMFLCYGEYSCLQGDWPALAEKYLAWKGCAVHLQESGSEPEEIITGVLEGLCLSGGVKLRRGTRTDSFLSGSLLPLLAGLEITQET